MDVCTISRLAQTKILMISMDGELEEELQDIPKKDIKVIRGHWNANVGRDREAWEIVMGRFRYGERNERRERLLDFKAHHMYIRNSKFQQKPSREWTCLSSNSDIKNMIDLILMINDGFHQFNIVLTFKVQI